VGEARVRRPFLGGLAVLFLAGAPASAGGGLAIVGATVFDGTGKPALADGVLVIGAEKIVAVGPRSHVALPKGIPYVDGRGLFLVPGRLAEPAVTAALRRRVSEGAAFEQAVADVLRSNGWATASAEPGHSADLLLLDKDPRVSLENLNSVKKVLSRGREIPR
jgi:imidazolonepropionase-like amidohydrolase